MLLAFQLRYTYQQIRNLKKVQNYFREGQSKKLLTSIDLTGIPIKLIALHRYFDTHATCKAGVFFNEAYMFYVSNMQLQYSNMQLSLMYVILQLCKTRNTFKMS